MKKIMNSNLINTIVKGMSIVIFSGIFLCIIGIDTKVEYNYQNKIKPDNYKCLIVIIMMLILVTSITILVKRIPRNKMEKIRTFVKEKSKWIIIILFILLFCVQIFILQNIFFETGWDLEHIFKAVNNYAETGVFMDKTYFMEYPYFSVYPNNLFLTAIFSLIGRILVQIFNYHGIYKALVLLDIILVDLAGIMTIKTIGNFTDKKWIKLLSALMFIAFIGLSPWFLIPYSDTYSILFPISVLYNYTKKERKVHNYFLIGFCSYFGYLIKPTTIIVLIAITIIEAYKMLFKIKELKSKEKIKALAVKASSAILGIIIVMILKIGIEGLLNYDNDKEYEISLFHYLMMGINQQSTGAFSHLDVVESLSIDNYQDRVARNKEIFVERFKSLSLKDMGDFYTKKILVNYNDGTLAWGREGGFFDNIKAKNNRWANILMNFYYNHGTLFDLFNAIMQTQWLFILAFIMIATIFRKFDDRYSVAFLALIGLTIFTLLFEARARYLYLYGTYYIVLAVMGIDSVVEKVKKFDLYS